MRLGVLDVGSNTIHLLVVDAHYGASPVPAATHKTRYTLSELLDKKERITDGGADHLIEAVREATHAARKAGVEDITGFATSALREARNGEQVLQDLRDATDVDLQVLEGEEEASLTFLAARRWFGWSAGRLLVLDIGGGSLEVATGDDEDPDIALSLPLGAGRLTRRMSSGDPPAPKAVRELEEYVRDKLTALEPHRERLEGPDLAVATSKSFRTLARIGGAAPSRDGPYVPRRLRFTDVAGIRASLASMTIEERLRLPAVSEHRAGQLLAAAIVAERTMAALALDEVSICPWALREGIILRRLDWLLTD